MDCVGGCCCVSDCVNVCVGCVRLCVSVCSCGVGCVSGCCVAVLVSESLRCTGRVAGFSTEGMCGV